MCLAAILGSAAASSSSYVTWAPSRGRMSSRLRLSSSARLAQSCPGRLISGVCDEAKPAQILAIQNHPLFSRLSIGRSHHLEMSARDERGCQDEVGAEVAP